MTDSPVKMDFRDVATALIKQQKIHEGFWGVYLEFGVIGANFSMKAAEETTETVLLPTAIIPIRVIGLQRFPEMNELTVDAAKVNPKSKAKPKATPKRKT